MYIENHKGITEEDFQFANLIWDFLSIRDQIKKADLIFVLCSHDLRVAKYAALLFKQGYAKHILFSGGLNFFTKNIFTKSEAESFADVAISEEVPKIQFLWKINLQTLGRISYFQKEFLNL